MASKVEVARNGAIDRFSISGLELMALLGLMDFFMASGASGYLILEGDSQCV